MTNRDTRSAGKRACASCGTDNGTQARYCQNCGRSLTENKGGLVNAQTLTVLGAAGLTLLALGLIFASVIDDGTTVTTGSEQASASRTTQAPAGQPPDLSTMTPREAADRLFNRVMIADEQGNGAEVTQFAPMAVAAYEQLDSLDLDALYHLGLIHAASGDAESARDASEQIKAAVPGHLLASLMDHRLAVEANDQQKAEEAIERFRTHYDEEIGIDRAEYRHHRRSIDQFLAEINAGSSPGS